MRGGGAHSRPEPDGTDPGVSQAELVKALGNAIGSERLRQIVGAVIVRGVTARTGRSCPPPTSAESRKRL